MRLGRIGGAKHVAYLTNSFNTLVYDRDALLRSGLLQRHLVTIRRASPRHEANNVVELIVPIERTKDLPELLALVSANLETKLFFQRRLRFRSDDVGQTCPEHLADGSVEFHRLADAHPVHFDSHDVEPGA